MKYFITTFGCAQNVADSERIASAYASRGYTKAKTVQSADTIIINTCMIRGSAEDRVYGLVRNIGKVKNRKSKIVVTGCMVGMATRDNTGKLMSYLKRRMPIVDEFLPIEEVGFDYEPIRADKVHAIVPISNGCNNFCTYCVVPFSRGREISRPMGEIISECKKLAASGYKQITLVGQNVNSYGADLLVGGKNVQVMRDISKTYFTGKVAKIKNKVYRVNGKIINPTFVKHLGRLRIPTLFPQLLTEICKIKRFTDIDFLSSNPWDFSDELIDVIAKNKQIAKQIHLPVQSGNNEVLRRMNRWYTREEYLTLISKLKTKVPEIRISTDIIVGFPGETKAQFDDTVKLAIEVGYVKAYVSIYSDRPQTAAHKIYPDDIPHPEKKRRWQVLEDLINVPNLKRKSK